LEHGIAVNRPAAPAALPDEGMDLRNHMANIELGLINEALEHGIAVNRPAAPAALPDEGMDLRNHMANIELG
ncbi:sigma-54-dependent Fis family transcriptional regulator, partial [Stenotrophomonas maltophilia]